MTEASIPKIGEIVLFHHKKTRDDETGELQSPAIVSDVTKTKTKEGLKIEVDLTVLSTTIGVVQRRKIMEGTKPGEWSYREPAISRFLSDDII